MRAMLVENFKVLPKIVTVDDPAPPSHGAVINVKASGICRSDWHGWMGHDQDIVLPHVPGHELAGTIVALGADVSKWSVGDRVTVPFVGGCGTCPQCHAGHQQVCDAQFQPGFTHWGSFAEYVAIHNADLNLIALPNEIDFAAAASLGCRFATSFRAVVDQGKVSAGQWVAVHGCGGVGLSAIMIANALGANVIAVDIDGKKLDFAKQLGATITVNGTKSVSVPDEIIELSGGGVHVSIDALGHQTTCYNSIQNLRKRGKHIQVGLILAEHSQPEIPMGKVIADELEILGSHGMQAHRYGAMLGMITTGKLAPESLVSETISLADATTALINMDKFESVGAKVITKF